MKEMSAVKNVYFLGIGGIGMSALARWFLHEGVAVAGYDLTETRLTRELVAEGAAVHYAEDAEFIPADFRNPSATLVVYTPAVPSDHQELRWFGDNGFTIEKRSEVLGRIAAGKFTLAVAGTHGKTTTTTLTAWLVRTLTGGGSAFLGGISKNFDSNLVLDKTHTATESRGLLAVEADEFDRSFLRLNPDVALITSCDPDHLDIYGTYEAVREAFTQFTDRIKSGGAVVLNKKVDIEIRNKNVAVRTYSLDNSAADFYARNLRPRECGYYTYDIVTPDGVIDDCTLGITGKINVENSIGAVAVVWMTGGAKRLVTLRDHNKIREALASFRGVKRRFDIYVNTPTAVYMDDYAHHPEELAATINSLRAMFPNRRITAVFQPHLYTRTRDLCREFSTALSLADEVVLTPIYPARELPIEGVRSEIIGEGLTVPWRIVEKEHIATEIAAMPTDVVVTFGAGNIENYCEEIAKAVKSKI